MSAELVSCRFCGKTPQIVAFRVVYDTNRRIGEHEMFRGACACGAHGKCRPDPASAAKSWNEPWQALPNTRAGTDELVEALREARSVLHQHYVDWDGEPEDAVPLQLARSKIDALLNRIESETP